MNKLSSTMKLVNDNQTLTISENTVTIRDNGKVYKFDYSGVNFIPATSEDHYAFYRFHVGNLSAYEGNRQHFQRLSIGYNEFHGSVTFTAVYVKELKKGNKATHINGSFRVNITEWLSTFRMGEW